LRQRLARNQMASSVGPWLNVAIELLEDLAATLTHRPLGLDARPASATVSFRKPGDTSSLASGAATIASWSTTVSSVTDQTTFVVASATGLSQGLWVWLDCSDGWSGPVLISELNSTTVTLESPPPGTIAATDTLYPYEMTFALTAANTAERGLNYKALWTVTDSAGTVTTNQQITHIVRTQFYPAVTSGSASRYILAQYPGMANQFTAGHYEELARRASERVRSRIQGAGAYPHLIGDPAQFQVDVGVYSLRLELAREGLYPPGFDPSAYISDQERALERSIHDSLRAMQWIDVNDDGVASPGEVRTTFSIPAIRAQPGRALYDKRRLIES